MSLASRSILTTAVASGILIGCLTTLEVAPSLAGAGHNHGNEFETGGNTGGPKSVEVNADIAKRIGIKIEPAGQRRIGVGIKATGQIETQPNRQANVTIPTPGTVVELLVKPGDRVKKGQPVAVISSLELLQLRVESLDRRTDAEVSLREAQANLRLAQENLGRERQIAATEIAQAQTQLAEAQERYDGDARLVSEGALPRRQMLTSKTQLAEAKAALNKNKSRQAVLRAEAELRRVLAAVEGAKQRVGLSGTTYQTRLRQLRTPSNQQGLVVVQAPIAGTIAKREVTLGASFEDAGGQLMTIVNDAEVWATANVYEKDLDQLSRGQPIRLQVSSLPGEIFNGQIVQIDPVVAGETRVVPVRASVSNPRNKLKPGMFAELEIMTGRAATATTAIPSGGLVEVNNQSFAYVENGKGQFEPVKVELGDTFGGWVEIKRGLFDGDRIVTQGAMMLYAQSLQGGSQASGHDGHDHSEEDGHDHGSETAATPSGFSLLSTGNVPWWMVVPTGGAIAAGAYLAGRRGRSGSGEPDSDLTQTAEENGQMPRDGVPETDFVLNGEASSDAAEPSSVADEAASKQHQESA